MMNIQINPGQTLSIAAIVLASGATQLSFSVSEPETAKKRGPKSLPKSDAKAGDFHSAILKALKRGPLTSDAIRAKVGGTPENRNAVSWALVELQNAGARRGKNLPKTGPIQKLEDGRYQLRVA